MLNIAPFILLLHLNCIKQKLCQGNKTLLQGQNPINTQKGIIKIYLKCLALF